jgi:trimeric autotransporter adhesin
MRKLLASVLLVGLSLHFTACGGGNSNNGGTGGNGGGGGGTPPPVTLTSITVTTSTASVAPGTTAQFFAQGKFSDNSTQNLTSQVMWSSSATSVASMNFNGVAGLAKAVAGGTTNITASMSGVSGSANLTVTNASLVSIDVTPANPSINVGTQQQFTATGTFSDGTNQDISNVVKWTSSPSTVASITSASGLATGRNSGSSTITATFTATSGSVSGSTQLSVTQATLVSLAINPPNPTIAVNTFQSFTAVGTFSDGSTHNITTTASWSSSATNVATIPVHNAVAKGLAPGTTTITAASGSVTATTVLTVSNATLVTVDITPASLTIPAGVIINLSATGTFSDGSTQDLTVPCNWASTNSSVASVNNSGSSSGITTAISPGSTTITATAPVTLGSKVGTATVTVTTATLTKITLTTPNSNTIIAPSGNLQFKATGTYSDGTTQVITKAVKWTSSNTNVATVNGNGLATGQGGGAANISAAQNGVVATQGIAVTSSPLLSITVTSPNPSNKLAQQTSVQLVATGNFQDGSTLNLTSVATWTSSSPGVATVGSTTGAATGVATGSTNITALFGGIAGTLNNLQVTNATLTSVTVSPTTATMSVGASLQFVATGHFDDGSTEILTTFSNWSSNNASVALVSNSGLATGSQPGTATITVTATQGSNPPVTANATLTVQ